MLIQGVVMDNNLYIATESGGNVLQIEFIAIHPKADSVASVRKRTIPTERPPPVGEVSVNVLRIEGYHVISVMDPYGRILGFIP
jgi:hypothetical protein